MAVSRATLRSDPEASSYGDKFIMSADSRATLMPEAQSSNPEEYTIVGNDVEALFPSLTDLESARIAREAVETSDMTFQNIDVASALQYFRINGGNDYIEDIGLKKNSSKMARR